MLLASFFCFAGISVAQAADNSNTPTDVIKNFGDVLIYVVPSFAIGMTFGAKDYEGLKQFSESAVVGMGIVTTLKYTVHSTRPNGETQSFPSGHAAITFLSAEFLRKHYGWQYGLPAYVVATYVAYSRVQAHEHYIRDVVAGAAIGFASSYFITKPYYGWNIRPVAGQAYLGMQLNRSW
jgi:membrane-associated phospholipid phosphatase